MRKALKIAAILIASAIGTAVLLLAAATLYLTPDNLTRLLNEKASDYFTADVETHNVRFTLWSTFPHFYLEMDSLRITSRTLDSISPRLRRQLPDDARQLVTTARLKGSVNILRLLAGEVKLKSLTIDDLDLNLVAINDSINNYDIIPPTGDKDFEVPRFTAGYVILRHPHPIRYFSAATSTQATASLSKARIIRLRDEFSKYSLALDGKLSARVLGTPVLTAFPFHLDGLTSLRFHPFRVSFSNFAINLGNTRGKLNMSMNLGQSMSINNFNYRLQPFDLTEFLRFLPVGYHPYVNRITTDLIVEASARLTAPYKFSADRLPSFVIDFEVPEGEVGYTVNSHQSYTMHHSQVSGQFNFNGDNAASSFFVLKPFALYAGGVALRMQGSISHLLDNPEVRASVSITADLQRIGHRPELRQYALKGQLDADADISFGLDKLTGPDIHNIRLEGTAALDRFEMVCGNPSVILAGSGIRIGYDGFASRYCNQQLLRSSVNASANTESLDLLVNGIKIEADNLNLKGGGTTAAIDSRIALRKMPYTAHLNIGRMRITSPGDSLSACLNGISLSSIVNNIGSFTAGSSFNAGFATKKASVASPSSHFNASGLRLEVNAARRADGSLVPPAPTGTVYADTALLSRIRHSAQELSLRLPDAALDFINSWEVAVNITTDTGNFTIPAYPQRIDFANFSLAATPDKVRLRSLSLRSQSSACRLRADATGLRTAFNYGPSAIIRANAAVAIDTLNINQIAYAYEQGQIRPYGPEAVKAVKPDTVCGADTVTFLIPRNLALNLNASAKETVYTNLHLYDLNTTVNLADGLARVRNLRIGSDFGHAYLDLDYDTRDIQGLGIKANVSLDRINVPVFFDRFRSLLLMMPQMKNLSGYVSAHVNGSMKMFPDMYIDIPSLEADMSLEGRQLKVHQTKFIRRITRMMLIPNSDDIHIRNMNVHATVHDNLLELYPFRFEFSNYRLEMEGLNNFNGRLFYHIGVMKNPLHLPFGINIQGYFHSPQLRFGGAHYPRWHSLDITSRTMGTDQINIVRELKYYLKEFVHKAAQPGATL